MRSAIWRITPLRPAPTVMGMTEVLTIRRVEVRFVDRPPTRALQRTRLQLAAELFVNALGGAA